MPFRAETYRVFIASPSDLTEERQVATDAINEWNAQHAAAESVVLLPVKWETHAMPQSGIRPQQAINDQLVSNCDILVGMFWTKIGTSTGVAESGTVEEIDKFVGAGKPAMLYFSSRPIDPNSIDLEQQRRLRQFKQETYRNALVGTFSGPNELHRILLRDLTHQVRKLKSTSEFRTEEDAEAKQRRNESLETARKILETPPLYGLHIPKLCVSLGPQLPHNQIATREDLFEFVKSTASKNQIATPEQRFDSDVQANALFQHPPIQRYPGGIFCLEEAPERDPWSRRDGRMATAKLISFDQYGLITCQIAMWERSYYTRFNPGGGPTGETDSYFFWHIVLYLQHVLFWAAEFYKTFQVHTNLLLRVSLEELRGQSIKLFIRVAPPYEVSISEITTEDIQCQSDTLESHASSSIGEACYQLLWQFPIEQPLPRDEIQKVVEHFWDGTE